MNALKLQIDEFEDVNFNLFAIHTQLEDFRIAFFINKVLQIHLIKNKNDIVVNSKNKEINFSHFLYEDEANDSNWDLFQNKSKVYNQMKLNNLDLFQGLNTKYQTNSYLISEYKKVDYFLKINQYNFVLKNNEIINLIQSIERVSAVYLVETENLKSKNNLIFQ
jgi:hypothetical protein